MPHHNTKYKTQKLRPKKSLGQHFLVDSNVVREIVDSSTEIEGSCVIEVGPGKGILTKALLEHDPKHVVAIELDSRLIENLRLLEIAYENLTVMEYDACKIDEEVIISELGFNEPVCIISNLPYNVSTPLIMKWLKKPMIFKEIIVMIQKELADRFTALPRTKDYGAISVLSQLGWSIEKQFNVPPTSFYPAPKVDSSVVRFIPKPGSEPWSNRLKQIVSAGFSSRRKMARKLLLQFFEKASSLDTAFDLIGIAKTARAEEITPEQFLSLANFSE